MILAFDTETTGFWQDQLPLHHPRQPHMVQLAVVMFDLNVYPYTSEYEAIIRPDGWIIPPEASAVHGITQERAVTEGIPLVEIIDRYLGWRKNAHVLVAHNAEFDIKILASSIARAGRTLDSRADLKLACTKELATPVIKMSATPRMVASGRGGQFKPPTLAEAYRHFFQEELVDAHSALVDAKAVARIYHRLMKP